MNSIKKYLDENQLCWLVFLILSVCVFFTHLPKVETNLISLIGNNFALSAIFGKSEKSVQVLVSGNDFEQAQQNSEKFYNSLDLSYFSSVRYKVENQNEILQKMEQHRYGLLAPEDRKLLLEGNFEKIRKNAEKKIKSSVFPPVTDFEKDPFYLFTNYTKSLLNVNQIWQLKNGYMTTEFEGKSYILIVLKLKSIDMTIVNYLREKAKMGNVSLSGTPLHTAETTEICKKQINIISAVSIITVIVLAIYLLGHIRYLIPIILNLISSFFVGCFALLLFDKIHLITFVFATSLIGLSIDYSFYYLSCNEEKRPQLIKNMIQAFCTTAFCFIPLFFASMPVLKQIATFTIIGLATVFLNTILFYPKIKIKPSADRLKLPKISGWFIVFPILLILSLVIRIPVFNTDMQNLYKPSKENLKAEQQFLKVSQFQETKVLVITADYVDSILEVEEQVKEKSTDYYSLSSIVPSKIRQKQNTELVKKLYEEQLPILKKNLKIKKDIKSPITYPLTANEVWDVAENFVYVGQDRFNSVTPVPDEVPYSVRPKELMQKTMNDYAKEIYKSLIISACCLVGILVWFYRKKVLLYILPSLLSLGCLIAILSWLNVQVNFFHLLSFFIVIGVGIDYAIFNLSGHANKAELCAFLSSFVGFGMLSFVDFKLISSMGFVLGLGLLFNFVFSLMQYKKKVV